MALQKTIVVNGLTAVNAYIRIDTVSGYKGGLTISVNSYVSRAASLGSTGYLEQKLCNFVPSVAQGSENFIRQGYFYLKALPEYVDAIDILEDA